MTKPDPAAEVKHTAECASHRYVSVSQGHGTHMARLPCNCDYWRRVIDAMPSPPAQPEATGAAPDDGDQLTCIACGAKGIGIGFMHDCPNRVLASHAEEAVALLRAVVDQSEFGACPPEAKCGHIDCDALNGAVAWLRANDERRTKGPTT